MTIDNETIELEFKHFNLEKKQYAEENGRIEIKGYASDFEIDSMDDQVMPGAFTGTIKKFKADKKAGIPFPVLYSHNTREQIGRVESFKEDDVGLFFKASLNAEVDVVQKTILPLIKGDDLSGISIGFKIPSINSVKFVKEKDRIVRQIYDIMLGEISLVSIPAVHHARLVKSVSLKNQMLLQHMEKEKDTESPAPTIELNTESLKLALKQANDELDLENLQRTLNL